MKNNKRKFNAENDESNKRKFNAENDESKLSDFYKSIPYYHSTYDKRTILDSQAKKGWSNDIHLYKYLIESVGTINGRISIAIPDKLPSNNNFNDFFLRYWELVDLRKDISFVINKKKITEEESKHILRWKNGNNSKLQLNKAIVILFCTCEGHLISDFIGSIDKDLEYTKEIKECLEDLVNDVLYYYENRYHKKDNLYNTFNFMDNAFKAVAEYEGINTGLNPWSQWKLYWGVKEINL